MMRNSHRISQNNISNFKKRKESLIYCYPNSFWSMVKLATALPLKRTKSFPFCIPARNHLVESCPSASLSHFLELSSVVFYLMLPVAGGGKGRYCHRSLSCPYFSSVCAVIDMTLKVDSLLFTVSKSTNHGLPCGFLQQHRP